MVRSSRLWVAAALVTAPLLLGMGGGGAGPVSDTIPRPEENHTATLRDTQGVVTEVARLACGGKTFLPLQRGEGTLMVPFSRVQRVALADTGPGGVATTVFAVEGQELAGTLEATLEVTGETGLGNYRVPVGGLAEIVFQ